MDKTFNKINFHSINYIDDRDYLLPNSASIVDLLAIFTGATSISNRFYKDENGDYQKEWITKPQQIEVTARMIIATDIHNEPTENYVANDPA